MYLNVIDAGKNNIKLREGIYEKCSCLLKIAFICLVGTLVDSA